MFELNKKTPLLKPVPKNQERFLKEDEIIVSKTDTKGIIRYANKTFLSISDYTIEDLLGKPHSFIRHPDMPRAVFKLFWETLVKGDEIFAYVKNLCKNGEFYWVLAHVTPTFDINRNIVGYHSNRRSPDRNALKKVEELYSKLIQIEQSAGSKMEGLEKSYAELMNITTQGGKKYGEFIFEL